MAVAKALSQRLVLLAAIVGVAGCDSISKHVAAEALAGQPTQSLLFDVIRLGYTENQGSFLGLGAELPASVRFAVFTVGVGILLVSLIAYAVRRGRSSADLLGFGMIFSGGASNWVDRLSDGRVVDFLNVGIGPIRTGIFNIADMAILAGVVVLLCGEYWNGRQRHRAKRAD